MNGNMVIKNLPQDSIGSLRTAGLIAQRLILPETVLTGAVRFSALLDPFAACGQRHPLCRHSLPRLYGACYMLLCYRGKEKKHQVNAVELAEFAAEHLTTLPYCRNSARSVKG